MKKNTISVLLLAAALTAGFKSFAQNAELRQKIAQNSDTKKLEALHEQFSAKYAAKRQEALRLAAINNWPVVIRDDYNYAELMDVTEEGQPLYYTTYNAGSAITSRVTPLHPGGSTGYDLTGSNTTVGPITLGIWDSEYPLSTHNDFAGRFNPVDGPAVNPALHPTHVLGTMIGSGAGNIQARGMAYEAYANVNNFANDIAEISAQSQNLILSNHSYGLVYNTVPTANFGAYTSLAQDMDEITYAAKYYQPVFAAGNDGNVYDNLSGWQTAKNVVVVGAILEVESFDENGKPQNVQIANFSNFGPTNDRRIKPDIVTKGVGVFSTSNAGNNAYATLQGTSMACPGVTGAFALIQEHYALTYYDPFLEIPYMKSATLRALMAHTADDAVEPAGPDPRFGWGVINAQKAAETITKAADATTAILEENVLTQGGTYTFEVQALGTEPLIATIAWTDPAAATTTGSSPRLINDLDIRITKNGTTYYPWRLASTNTGAAVQADNTVDNIEKIEISNPTDTYTITISHKGSTLENTATNEPNGTQQYSLVVTGIDVDLSVDDLSRNNLFSVWPNPASGHVNIELANASENTTATFYDVQGRVVKSSALTGVNTLIDVQGLSKGVYLVKVADGAKSQTRKVVIE